MTMATTDTGCADEPNPRKIGGILTPPLMRDAEYLRSLGYTDSEIVRRGVATLATHERQIRGVRV